MSTCLQLCEACYRRRPSPKARLGLADLSLPVLDAIALRLLEAAS